MWSDQIGESQPRLRKAGLPFLFSTFPPFRGNSRAMTLDIKICGLKTEDALAAALSGGASHVGFIFFPKSPRNIASAQAGRLRQAARGRAKAVAVTVDADDAALDGIVAAVAPDMLQLHGKETPDRVAAVKARYGLPVIVVIGNDARWNAEYQIQLRTYGKERAQGCELLPARYDKVVEALGGHGEYVTAAADLPAALARAFKSGKPACINVLIESVPAPTIKRS